MRAESSSPTPGGTARGRADPRRVLIASVGYHNLRDMSLGPILLEQLRREDWPSGTELQDFSYGPVFVMHNLAERPAYDRIVFVAGVQRSGRPGEIEAYRWKGDLPPPEEIQARMEEAVTGVISLDNLLIVATFFGKLPPDVRVVEVEAADAGWGEGLTPQLEAVVPEVLRRVRSEVEAE